MPQKASAAKSQRQSEKRRQRNKATNSRLRTEIKKFGRAVERGDIEEARGQLDLVTKLLHKAVSKGILHKNTAGRRQARLQKMLNNIVESQD
jgi:small subunit ribosomal protein S20